MVLVEVSKGLRPTPIARARACRASARAYTTGTREYMPRDMRHRAAPRPRSFSRRRGEEEGPEEALRLLLRDLGEEDATWSGGLNTFP